MKNPYPEFIDNGLTRTTRNYQHTIWQKGYDAKEKEDQDLYEALKVFLFTEFGSIERHKIDKALQAIAKWEGK